MFKTKPITDFTVKVSISILYQTKKKKIRNLVKNQFV